MIGFWMRLAAVIAISVAILPPVSKAGQLAGKAQQAISALQGTAKKLKVSGATVLAGTAIIVACANLTACDFITDIATSSGDTSPRSSDLVGTLPIMQGATTTNQTQLFIMTDTNTDYNFTLTNGSDTEIQPSAVDKRDHAGFPKAIQRVLFDGLSAQHSVSSAGKFG